MSRKPGYCYYCGRELTRDAKPRGYHTGTGDPVWTYSCPRSRDWWRVGQYHTEKVYGLL